MIIVNIIGGLGNQMFQYAFAYAISQKNKTQLRLDVSNFKSYDLRKYELDRYCIIGNIAENSDIERLKYKKENLLMRVFRRFNKQQKPYADSYYKEVFFQFDNGVVNQQGDVYFDGYWQSEKYFQDYRDDLLKHFVFKESVHAQSKYYQQRILTNHAVSLHIRRGDYVSNAKTNSIHGTCELNYYRDAFLFMNAQLRNPHFFIFSDDLNWAKKNFNFIKDKSFVELEKNTSDHEEMYLMSQCQHNIIANSSFSWWGAWLNQNPDKIVIAPQRWFTDSSINTKDLVPESWIRL